nr:hypothetical protein [Tanacetum cinerariifolium]
MSSFTDVKYVITQKALDAFCNKFHIPEEVHLILPNQNDMMHERPARKIRDPASVAVDFNTQDYATLIAHPSMFWKFLEAFLCLVGLSRHYTLDEETYPWFLHKNREEMDIFAFIHTPNPTKVRVVERERNEASVDRIFDEGGSGNQAKQGDFAGGGQDANIHLVVEAADTAVENVAPVQLRHQRKRKYMIVDAGRVSHPPKKPREDHGTSSGTSMGGKSWSTLHRLLAGAVLNAKVGVAAIPTLPFVTASVSITSKREDGDHTDSVAELNVCTIGAPSFIPIMTTITTVTSTVDPTSVTKASYCRTCREMVDELAHPKFFASVRGMEHDQLFAEFNVGAARQMSLNVREENSENLKAQLLLREEKAAKAIRLRAEASNFEAVEKSFWDETNALRERNAILEKERNALDVKPCRSAIDKAIEKELKSHKDASIETVMDILCLEGPLVDKLGLDKLQPNVDQLMKIKENVSNHISDLHDVFVPLAEPFCAAALTGTEGTFDAATATADATMVLPTTFASASTIAPISVDDYEIIGVDDQAVSDGDAASFPNVDDAELNIPQ